VTGRSSIPRPLPCHDVLLSLILFGLLNTETPHRAASSAHQALSDPGHRARTPAGLDAPSRMEEVHVAVHVVDGAAITPHPTLLIL
jgi:hypothetical protein